MDEQEADDRNEQLVEQAYVYLMKKTYPSDCSETRRRVIRKKAARFEVKDGELHYKQKQKGKGEVMLRYIVSKQEQEKILLSCHVDPTAGHMGRTRTLHRIKERFMWHGMVKDVQNMLSKCDICQRMNRKLTSGAPELHPIPVKSPWHMIGIDFIGPLSPEADDGSRYILTLSDYFTKWVEAIPTADKSASSVATALFKVFMRMGIPQVVLSDNGREFNNELDNTLASLLGIDRRLTTPYHPQANGLDERFNQTLQNILVKYVSTQKGSWSAYLDTCVFGYNTSRHESSKFTPFQLMFGRQATLPIDIQLRKASPEEVCQEYSTLDDPDTSSVSRERAKLLEKAKHNILIAQQKQKDRYDQKHATPERFQVDQLVLKKDFTRKKSKGGKLKERYLGPYAITKVLRGTYELAEPSNRGKTLRATGTHLKPYNLPEQAPSPCHSQDVLEDGFIDLSSSDAELPDSEPVVPPPVDDELPGPESAAPPTPDTELPDTESTGTVPPSGLTCPPQPKPRLPRQQLEQQPVPVPRSSSACPPQPKPRLPRRQLEQQPVPVPRSSSACPPQPKPRLPRRQLEQQPVPVPRSSSACPPQPKPRLPRRQLEPAPASSPACPSPPRFQHQQRLEQQPLPASSPPYPFLSESKEDSVHFLGFYTSTPELRGGFFPEFFPSDSKVPSQINSLDSSDESIPPLPPPLPSLEDFVHLNRLRNQPDPSSQPPNKPRRQQSEDPLLSQSPRKSFHEQQSKNPPLLQPSKRSSHEQQPKHPSKPSSREQQSNPPLPPSKRPSHKQQSKRSSRELQDPSPLQLNKHIPHPSPSKPKPGDSQANPITVSAVQVRPTVYWVEGLALSSRDRQQLYNGNWLTDKHVNTVNRLLAAQFPTQNGLCDPLIAAEYLQYTSGAEDFVQIMCIARNHRVCVSNVLSPPGVVEVYDSIPAYSTSSTSLRRQVAAIMRTPSNSFELKHVDIQRQVGSSDCALFAIAFATTLCTGGDPHITSYVQAAMREHLGKCFENQTISPFPAPDRPRRLGRQRVISMQTIHVYCVCRLPWNKHDHERGPLVKCIMCGGWYHQMCLAIDQNVIDYPAYKYNCNICLGI